jgi:T-complex protein 1 subunit theta
VCAQFAEALEVIPRTLSENAGLNATDVLSALYAAHAAGNRTVGVDVEVRATPCDATCCIHDGLIDCAGASPLQGTSTLDVLSKGIFDCYVSKLSAFTLAMDAALTVLRVDQIIMAKQAGGPKPRESQGPDQV